MKPELSVAIGHEPNRFRFAKYRLHRVRSGELGGEVAIERRSECEEAERAAHLRRERLIDLLGEEVVDLVWKAGGEIDWAGQPAGEAESRRATRRPGRSTQLVHREAGRPAELASLVSRHGELGLAELEQLPVDQVARRDPRWPLTRRDRASSRERCGGARGRTARHPRRPRDGGSRRAPARRRAASEEVLGQHLCREAGVDGRLVGSRQPLAQPATALGRDRIAPAGQPRRRAPRHRRAAERIGHQTDMRPSRRTIPWPSTVFP